MKRFGVIAAAALLALTAGAAFAAAGTVNWVAGYVEAEGQAVVPEAKSGTPAGELLAKRGAMVDLQRHMLEQIRGVQVDAATTMKDFEVVSDRVRTEVRGLVRGIQVVDASFIQGIYTLRGRIPIVEVRKLVAPEVRPKAAAQKQKPAPAKAAAPKTGGKLTGVIIDVRHLKVVPSTTFRVIDEKGRVVYSLDQVDYDRFLRSGLCQYHDNMNYAKGLPHIAPNFITVKALRMTPDRVDIVLKDADAAKLAGPQPFKKTCAVVVVLGE